MRPLAWLLIISLVAPATAQLPTEAPSVPDATGGLEAQADNATGQAATTVDEGAAQAAGTTEATVANRTVTAGATATVIIHPTTAWSFRLPLDEDTFRLRGADGEIRQEVQITVQWREAGEPVPWPGNATLHMDGSQRHRFAAIQNGSEAHFTIPAATLIPQAHNEWRLSVHADAGLGWSSAYDNGTDAAFEGPLGFQGRALQAHDSDRDGHADDVDNCSSDPNADQANMDGDLHGDACDEDIDGDGYSNEDEAAAGSDPRNATLTPDDLDGDGHNNTAEEAAGSDPRDAASTPDDPDADGHSNAVEVAAGSDPRNASSTPMDPDADGLENQDDNCDRQANPDQLDGDADGIGDACDTRPDDGPAGDQDGDGVQNSQDNCGLHANADQANMDGDRLGDVCDADIDGDGHINWAEPFRFDPREWNDNDDDGVGDNADQDDDNDGLSDDAEAATGTDPLRADTDGDRYTDLDEVRMGTDPTVHHDPAYLPTARAIANTDGSVTIEWNATGDARVARYIVWERGSTRLVGDVQAGSGPQSLRDDAPGDGDLLYAVQPVFHDEMFERDAGRSAEAYLFIRDAVAWQVEASGDAPAPGQQAAPETSPVEDAPGLGIVVLMAAIVLASHKRRQV